MILQDYSTNAGENNRNKLRVVHVGTNDIGGAYNAMCRISKAMTLQGITSDICLREKKEISSDGIQLLHGVSRLLSKSKNLINNLISPGGMHLDFLGTDISKSQIVKDADVLLLHWTNSFISYKSLERLRYIRKPVIIVLHDMWIFTGGCHYDNYCGEYTTGCNDCPVASSLFKKTMIKWAYKRKNHALKMLNPVLVMPSTWMKKCAEKSPITSNMRSYVIPNPIDLDLFGIKPQNKPIIGTEGKKVILFSAMNPFTNATKGFPFLMEAVKKIQSDEYVLVVCGDAHNSVSRINNTDVICLGIVYSEQKMVEIYNSADVFVAPSRQDNYPNSILEALSCGLPCVAFDIGGMPDLITHKKTGYLAEYGDSNQLYEGIMYCIENKGVLRDEIRSIRENVNSPSVVGESYVRLCQKI